MPAHSMVPGGLLHPLQIEWDADLRGGDPLGWPDYGDTLARLPRGDSVVTGRAVVGEHDRGRYVVIAGRFDVVGGSMGAVHGERVARAYRRAMLEKLPVVILASSGGARLQEGLVALVQLARTASAARVHARAGLLSVAILRSPTTGGVLASYASLADLRAATPGAMIGFAGPRVAELVTGTPVRSPSHTAEGAFAAGQIDALVQSADERAWVEGALGLRDIRLPSRPLPAGPGVGGTVSPWGAVLRARTRSRPTGIDHAARLCDSWIEIRGADPVMRAGLARIGPRRVVVIAHDRHAGTGRIGVEGFRLAQRALALASRLRIPVLSFVDTPGAEPGAAAEASGIAAEIAATLSALSAAPVPTVSVCVGEGGSGGAMATGACDVVLMLEHAVWSVISPEAAAEILARDTSKASEYAARLRLTASDLHELGFCDAPIPESDPAAIDAAIRLALDRAVVGARLERLDAMTARWLR